MTVKVESFTAKVKRYLRVIVLISSHEKEMGVYFHFPIALFRRYSSVKVQSHISSNHLLIQSIFLSSISSFLRIDSGWVSVYDRLHAHIEKQRLSETGIYILDLLSNYV